MKKSILFTVAVFMCALGASAQTTQTEQTEEYPIISDTAYAYSASPSESETPSAEPQKTTSSKNSISSDSEKVTKVESMKDLAIYPLFEKYKRNKKTRLSVIDQSRSTFMTLDVYGDPEIMKEVSNLVDEVMEKNANSIIKNYDETSDEFVVSVPFTNKSGCTIIYRVNLDGKHCSLSINGPKP